jgi:hypothetical protein
MKLDLPYLFQDVDRHGNVRLYVRKRIGDRIKRERLRQLPGSPTFLAEYQIALERLKAGEGVPTLDQTHVRTVG